MLCKTLVISLQMLQNNYNPMYTITCSKSPKPYWAFQTSPMAIVQFIELLNKPPIVNLILTNCNEFYLPLGNYKGGSMLPWTDRESSEICTCKTTTSSEGIQIYFSYC